MTTKIEIALQSPATWAIIGAVLSAVLGALVPYLNGTPLKVVQDILMVYAMFAAPHEIQKAGNTR